MSKSFNSTYDFESVERFFRIRLRIGGQLIQEDLRLLATDVFCPSNIARCASPYTKINQLGGWIILQWALWM